MRMDRSDFVTKFGAVFEHSAWVADAVYDNQDDLPADAGRLAARFESVFLESDPSRQLATLRAHPQLVCALAAPGDLTNDSMSEQSGAGLDQCSASELAEFGQLNVDYSTKFGFPFIVAVKGRNRLDILKMFKERLKNDLQSEFRTALQQTCQIARFRIMDIIHD